MMRSAVTAALFLTLGGAIRLPAQERPAAQAPTIRTEVNVGVVLPASNDCSIVADAGVALKSLSPTYRRSLPALAPLATVAACTNG